NPQSNPLPPLYKSPSFSLAWKSETFEGCWDKTRQIRCTYVNMDFLTQRLLVNEETADVANKRACSEEYIQCPWDEVLSRISSNKVMRTATLSSYLTPAMLSQERCNMQAYVNPHTTPRHHKTDLLTSPTNRMLAKSRVSFTDARKSVYNELSPSVRSGV
ncbi:hypothetical protein BaRGS_00029062, partial [Batillaria attramentaria]